MALVAEGVAQHDFVRTVLLRNQAVGIEGECITQLELADAETCEQEYHFGLDVGGIPRHTERALYPVAPFLGNLLAEFEVEVHLDVGVFVHLEHLECYVLRLDLLPRFLHLSWNRHKLLIDRIVQFLLILLVELIQILYSLLQVLVFRKPPNLPKER